MKKSSFPIAVFFLMFFSVFAKAQQQDWAPVGAKWYFDYYAFLGQVGYLEVTCTEKKIIDGKECSFLKKRLYGYDQTINEFYEYDWSDEYTYQENGKVYFRESGNFRVLYDFTASVNDSWEIKGGSDLSDCLETDEPGLYVVDETGIDTIQSTTLRYFLAKRNKSNMKDGNWYMYGKIVERIGKIEGYMFPYPNCITEVGLGFRCYYDDDFGWYHKNDSIECDYIPTRIPNNNALQLDLKTYPNPASNTLNVLLSDENLKLSQIIIYSLNGKELKTLITSGTKELVDISNLEAGIYFIKVVLSDRKSQTMRSFIKN